MDIIICTYNNAKLLGRALTAIAQQQVSEGNSWSVLVVDNNCTDETAVVVNKHINSRKIPGLRRVTEQQQGLTYARICGIRNTTNEWLAFVDDDCILSENWIENAIQFASSHPACGAFGGKVVLDWEVTPSPVLEKYAKTFAANDRGGTEQQLHRNSFHIPGAGFVVRRSALEKSGWLNQQFLIGREGKKLTAGDDSEIVLRILNAGYELWYTPNCVLHHFIPARRISETYLVEMIYGLGVTAPYIAGLRWNHSYLIWLTVSLLRLLKYCWETASCAIITLIHPSKQIETLLNWSWTKGQLDGLISILTLCSEERATWLSIFKRSIYSKAR